MIEEKNKEIPVYRQCELIGLARASYYYVPKGESAYNIKLMNLIDEQYTRTPYFGVPRMTEVIRNKGYMINYKRVSRLMKKMGLTAIYPKPKTSKSNLKEKKYPYLLRDLNIERANHVWATDITYIKMRKGFVYLTVIMDWFSRYVISWKISITMEVDFCIEALQLALETGQPEIFNNDQGSQYTSPKFTEQLISRGILISMAGRGRCYDNIFVERLWRYVKNEEVYIKDYANVKDVIDGLRNYFKIYNTERPHQSLNYKTPEKVYLESIMKQNIERSHI